LSRPRSLGCGHSEQVFKVVQPIGHSRHVRVPRTAACRAAHEKSIQGVPARI
jgi:hypothetical protein